MSKIDSIFKAVGISTVILYGSLTPVIAASSSEQHKEQTDYNSIVSETKKSSLKINRNISSLIPQTIAQSPPTEAETSTEEMSEEMSEVNPLDPNPDKLAIPTTPEEVTIDINPTIKTVGAKRKLLQLKLLRNIESIIQFFFSDNATIIYWMKEINSSFFKNCKQSINKYVNIVYKIERRKYEELNYYPKKITQFMIFTSTLQLEID